MRLTLRTLLAYLDDTLEPSQAKQIGQKVTESGVAQELIARIQKLLRERRLTSPPLTGARFDANTIAEYLDSVLTGEQLAEVEDVLLNSDFYLAEAASVHQILTLFLGQPDTVSAQARKRMYGLVKQPSAPVEPRTRRPLPPEPDDIDDQDDASDDDYDGLEVPGYLRADRRKRRLTLAATAVGLLLLLGLVAWPIWSRMGGAGKSSETLVAFNPETNRDEATPTQPEKPPATQPEKPPVTPPEKPLETIPEKPPEKPPEKQPIDKVENTRPNLERRESIGRHVPGAGQWDVLFRRPLGQEQWKLVPRDGPVATAETLVSLPGFRAEVQLESGVLLGLLGNIPEFHPEFPFPLESSVVLHVPATGMDADLTLERGRVLLANARPQGEARIRVRFADEVWDLTLKDRLSTAAIELWGIHPDDVPFDKNGKAEGPMFYFNVLALKGAVDLQKTRYREESMPPSSVCFWNSRKGLAPGGAQPMTALPRWFTDAKPPLTTPQAKEMAQAITDLGAQLEKKPVDIVLAEARKDPRAAHRIMAIRCLGAIDAINVLMDILADDGKDAALSRDFATFALGHWIGCKPENEMVLYRTLFEKMRTYSRSEAEMVLEGLHTFSEEDLKSPDTYEKLIANLTNKKVAIRHLSYWKLLTLVPDGRSIRYDPAGDKDVLAGGQREWKKRIPDGTLPAKPKPTK